MSIKIEVSTLEEALELAGFRMPDLPDFVIDTVSKSYEYLTIGVEEISDIARELDSIEFDNGDDIIDLAISKGLVTEETFEDIDVAEWITDNADTITDLYGADYSEVYGFTNDYAYIYYRD
jgi:hypothetical protein